MRSSYILHNSFSFDTLAWLQCTALQQQFTNHFLKEIIFHYIRMETLTHKIRSSRVVIQGLSEFLTFCTSANCRPKMRVWSHKISIWKCGKVTLNSLTACKLWLLVTIVLTGIITTHSHLMVCLTGQWTWWHSRTMRISLRGLATTIP